MYPLLITTHACVNTSQGIPSQMLFNSVTWPTPFLRTNYDGSFSCSTVIKAQRSPITYKAPNRRENPSEWGPIIQGAPIPIYIG